MQSAESKGRGGEGQTEKTKKSDKAFKNKIAIKKIKNCRLRDGVGSCAASIGPVSQWIGCLIQIQ